LENRIGVYFEGQCGEGQFRIKADSEVTPEEIASSNLWLIGGVGENCLTAAFESSLIPFRLTQPQLGSKTISATGTVLLSFIYPKKKGVDTGYVYIEAGSDINAYRLPVVVNNDADYTVQSLESKTGIISTITGNFNQLWDAK
jgi:hypothetical protein